MGKHLQPWELDPMDPAFDPHPALEGREYEFEVMTAVLTHARGEDSGLFEFDFFINEVLILEYDTMQLAIKDQLSVGAVIALVGVDCIKAYLPKEQWEKRIINEYEQDMKEGLVELEVGRL